MRASMVTLSRAVVLALLVLASCAPAAESDSGASSSSGGGQTTAATSAQTLSILRLEPSATRVGHSGEVRLTCVVSNPFSNSLSYEWSATGGSFTTAPGETMTWVAPDKTGEWSVSVAVRDTAGHTASASVTLTVVENRPPAITSLQVAKSTLAMGESTEVTCVAVDPDGDALSYAWQADGGELSGVGPGVTWFAPRVNPQQKSTYHITVVIDDGNGGVETAEVTVNTVRILATPDVVLAPVARESATIRSDGKEYDDIAWAGDDAANLGYRAFWSYDITPLRGANVAQATIQFKTAFITPSHELDKQAPSSGDPEYKLWTQLNGLHIYQVAYDTSALPKYKTPTVLELTEGGLFDAPVEVDVTDLIREYAAGREPSNRFQVMAAFLDDTDANSFGAYISWNTVTLNVMYA